MEAIGGLSFLGWLICLIWALAGLVNPKALFFAHPDRKRRSAAFFFPLTCHAAFFFLMMAAAGLGWACWPLALVMAYLAFRFARKLRLEQPTETSVLEAETPREIEVRERLKELSDFNFIGQRTLKKYLPLILSQNEKIMAVTTGFLKNRWQDPNFIAGRDLTVTDKRLIFLHKPLLSDLIHHDIPYDQMSVPGLVKTSFFSSDCLSIVHSGGAFAYTVSESGHAAKIHAVISTAMGAFKAAGGATYNPPVYDIDEEDEDDDSDWKDRTPRSEWFPDWKDRLEYFLGRRPTKEEELHYRKLFGGDNECRFNLSMFASRVKNGRACIFAPLDDYYRPRYETLADTGVMPAGADIAPHDRLMALSMAQLRQLAKALNLPGRRSKDEILDLFKECPEDLIDENWPLTGMDINDLFLADIAAIPPRGRL